MPLCDKLTNAKRCPNHAIMGFTDQHGTIWLCRNHLMPIEDWRFWHKIETIASGVLFDQSVDIPAADESESPQDEPEAPVTASDLRKTARTLLEAYREGKADAALLQRMGIKY